MDGAGRGGWLLFFTGFLGLLGWFAMLGGTRRSLILGVGVFGALVVSALWLGARRGGMKHSRHGVES
jgi:hypothetical protein